MELKRSRKHEKEGSYSESKKMEILKWFARVAEVLTCEFVTLPPTLAILAQAVRSGTF